LAVEDDEVVGLVRFADDESAMAGGCSLPAIDLDAREGERNRLADGHVLQFSNRNPIFFCTFPQGGINEIGDRGQSDHSCDQTADDYRGTLNEFPPIDRFRHKYLQNIVSASFGLLAGT